MFKFKAKNRKIIHRLFKALSLSLVILFLAYAVYSIVFLSRVAPNTYFAGRLVGAKTHAEVEQIVSRSIDEFSQGNIKMYAGNNQFEVTLLTLGISFDKQMSARSVFGSSSDGFIASQLRIASAIFYSRNVEPVFSVDGDKFGDFLNSEFTKIEKPAQNSMVTLGKNGAQIQLSYDGVIVDRAELVNDLHRRLSTFSASPIRLSYVEDMAQVNTEGASEAFKIAGYLVGQTVVLTYKYDRWPISGAKLFDLLKFEPEKDEPNITSLKLGQTPISVKSANQKTGGRLKVTLDNNKVDELAFEIAKTVDRPTVDATLEFDGTKVINFIPAQDGLALDRSATKKLILAKLLSSDSVGLANITIELPVEVAHAKIANNEVNKLGIVELLGSGVSYFAGSIPNRVFNIGLGASMISGTIVKPDEVFSFDALVGPVSAAQGFKQGYIINKGRTVLDDGGGICQVSTTVFRAVLNAGLPVLKRTAHAYRVAYYEQHGFKPGFDATIFSPSVDFQFKNDTGRHILVQIRVDKANAKIEVDIYGTMDGRKVEISDPVVSNVKPAPAPLYQDDPTLPKGTIKQVDFAASGATSVFTRKVYKGNDGFIDATFRSNFRPWQAVYLVGTGG